MMNIAIAAISRPTPMIPPANPVAATRASPPSARTNAARMHPRNHRSSTNASAEAIAPAMIEPLLST
jgi:hypothetical protein